MKITKVELQELPSKHYSTDLLIPVNQDDDDYVFTVSVAGYGPKPSHREIKRGWEPDWGMNHVESDIHLFLAQAVDTHRWTSNQMKVMCGNCKPVQL